MDEWGRYFEGEGYFLPKLKVRSIFESAYEYATVHFYAVGNLAYLQLRAAKSRNLDMHSRVSNYALKSCYL